jgi:hypothetical protein
MDEIIIEDKKYISSKQAAKITGYAKDYVGQLCREGRVPARLVGRSWYVLETAIQDHRFGDPEPVVEKDTTKDSGAWESPRYEVVKEEMLPSINHLREATGTDGGSAPEPVNQLEDSWRAWFDRFEAVAPAEPEKTEEDGEEKEEEKEEEIEEAAEAEAVPIRTLYTPPPQEFLPHNALRVVSTYDVASELPHESLGVHRKGSRRGGIVMVQTIGALCALVMALAAVIGSGYLDEYILSNSQVSFIAGVSLYDR